MKCKCKFKELKFVMILIPEDERQTGDGQNVMCKETGSDRV